MTLWISRALSASRPGVGGEARLSISTLRLPLLQLGQHGLRGHATLDRRDEVAERGIHLPQAPAQHHHLERLHVLPLGLHEPLRVDDIAAIHASNSGLADGLGAATRRARRGSGTCPQGSRARQAGCRAGGLLVNPPLDDDAADWLATTTSRT